MSGPAKQSSRWGSFLQQAVAGVESRLDNILAEGDEATLPKKSTIAGPPAINATKSDDVISRSASPSSNRTQDRLQERLARALAAKKTAQKADSNPSTTAPSRTESPIYNLDSPRQSLDVSTAVEGEGNIPRSPPSTTAKENVVGEELQPVNDASQIEADHGKSTITAVPLSVPSVPSIQGIVDNEKPLDGRATISEPEATPRFSIESNGTSIPRLSIDSSRNQVPVPRASSTELSGIAPTSLRSSEDYEGLLYQLRSDFERSELQRQEEIHGYIERIDALQAKLQYLSKESAESARKASVSAPAGSSEKKLAEKEEQIAMLMAEGQQLSKTEMKHLTTIKKLRAKQNEDSKELAEAKKQQEKAEKDIAILSERLQRAESSERRSHEKQKQAAQLQRDLDSLKTERNTKDSVIADLRTQLETAIFQEKEADTRAVHESLELEKKRVAELEENVANLKIEKSLVADRAQAQIKELKDKMEMDAERSRVAAMEMTKEQQMLESKLEIMRARAEEVSSGATGDAQAKLLRQIETLQTQYAVASENWQGIEASLIARASSLEKEKDEAARRETDIRKKAREVTLKAKRHEDELEDTRSKLSAFQQELADQKAQLVDLRRRAEEAESALVEAKAVFEREKDSLKSEMRQRTEGENTKFQEEVSGPSSLGHSRAESPVTSTRKGLTSEFLGLQNLQLRRAAARSTTSEIPTSEKSIARRPSVVAPARSSGRGTPSRQDSSLSLRTIGEVPPDTPSIHTIDHDDFFERTESPSSPQQTINDMVSASTAAAGPSVQLVERMSSAVRRLENEKAATKEDLARLSAQRDEARAEIVALMREIEAKRTADSKIAELEAEIKDINSRYQTTLEMLGEKSELVDELQSDIVDLKAMYRELVERTVK